METAKQTLREIIFQDLLNFPWREGRDGWILGHQANGEGLEGHHFEAGIQEMLYHPEHTSAWILRADILEWHDSSVREWQCLHRLELVSQIHRRLLSRSLSQDQVDQYCLTLRSESSDAGLSIWLPRLSPGQKDLPLFHPPADAIVLEWNQRTVEIYFFALSTSLQATQKLQKLGSHLVNRLCKYAKGSKNAYQKKVDHDTLVARNDYQDTYLKLKRKYHYVLEHWVEKTDPQKHVWEDVGVAAYIIHLWKDMGRPPTAPFVDVGCGNGLLVFLLHSEGFTGYGFDLEDRKSWQVWRDLCLKQGLAPCVLVKRGLDPSHENNFPVNSFLIGNHADELTPWIPVLASVSSNCAGFLNIPCCLHRLDDRFTFQTYRPDLDGLQVIGAGESSHYVMLAINRITKAMSHQRVGQNSQDDAVSCSTPGAPVSRYGAYLTYILELTAKCGWLPELEALRIPSTKNWAIVGRRRAVPHANASVADVERHWKTIAEDVAHSHSFIMRKSRKGV